MAFITPLFAAILGLMYLYLSICVIKQRLKHQVSLGVGGNSDLEKAIRIHGNFIEYVPFCLVLLFLLENLTLSSSLTFWLGVALLVSRICHVIGMRNGKLFKFRQAGMLGTFGVILVSSLTMLWVYLPISL